MVQVTDMTGGDAVILDPQILLDTLGVAVATGGEFAEVFVEDRAGCSGWCEGSGHQAPFFWLSMCCEMKYSPAL